MRKLICDACGHEIDSIYERDKCLDPAGRFVVRKSIVHPDGEVSYTTLEYDLCQNCTNVLVEKIKESRRFKKKTEYSFLGYRNKEENGDKNENLEDEES